MHTPIPSWRRLLLPLALLAPAGALAGADASLPTAATLAAISGHWRLDPAHSTDYASAVAALIASEQQMAERRRREHRRRPGPDGIPPLGAENLPGEAAERIRSRYDDMLQPASELQLNAEGVALELGQAGEPARRYAPDTDGQRMDSYGTARWQSYWRGQEFQIRAKYTDGAVREQTFSIDRDSGALLVTLKFSDPQSGRLQVMSRYQRVSDDTAH